MKEENLTFYVIRNEEGKYYKTYKNYSRAGWVEDIASARIYAKESMPRGKVTVYSNQNPKEPIPEIVEMKVGEVKVIDQKARVAQAKLKKAHEVAERKKFERTWELKAAQERLREAEREIERLKRER